MSRRNGFTLVETLIALAVAATAAAVILTAVRGLQQRAEQERTQLHLAMRVINDAILVTRGSLTTVAPRPEADRLLIAPIREGAGPTVAIRNFSLRDEQPLPPLQAAYTPLQRYSIEPADAGRLSISFIAPALKPPEKAR